MTRKQESQLMATFSLSLLLTMVIIHLTAFNVINPIVACALTPITGAPAVAVVFYMWGEEVTDDAKRDGRHDTIRGNRSA